MIEGREEAVVLAVRRHGEANVILEVLSDGQGRHAGVVRGGGGRKLAPVLQPGAQLDVTWKARIADHLGSFTVEPVRSRAASVMGNALALSGLNGVTGLLASLLPERQAQPGLYEGTVTLLDLIGATDAWPLAYLHWEMDLLEALGVGLDLSACAATGAKQDLIYVSPKSGRAVSRMGAGEWADRMLPLPPVMLGHGPGENAEIAAALGTTGHFLQAAQDRPLPPARARLIDHLTRSLTRSC